MKRALRIITIIFLALTIVFTVTGGAGTACVAWNADTLGGNMSKMAPVMPQLKILVVLSIAAGLWGIYSTIRLSKGKPGGWIYTVIFLLAGAITSGVQYYFSATLRGSTAPNSMRLYVTMFTLLIVLLIRLPGIWAKIGFDRPGKGKSPELAGGAALFVSGLLTAATPLWAAPTHLFNGYNTANDLLIPLLAIGGVAALAGWTLLYRAIRPTRSMSAKAVVESQSTIQ